MSTSETSVLSRTRTKLFELFDGTKTSTSIWIRLFFLLPLLYLLVFLFAGLGYMFVISFWRVEQYVLIPDWTVANYITIATTESYQFFLVKSLVTASVVTVICLVIGYPIAYYISKNLRTHQQLTVLLTLAAPFFIGTLIRVFAHQGLIGPTGFINQALSRLGIEPIWVFNYNNVQTVIGEVYLWIPFMILSIFLSLENIDYSLLEAGYDAGATPLRAFYEIVWPLSRPGVVIGSVLVFVPTFTDSVVPQFVGGPDGAQFGMIVQSLFGESGEWAVGSALSVVAVIILVIAICLVALSVPWHAYSIGGDSE